MSDRLRSALCTSVVVLALVGCTTVPTGPVSVAGNKDFSEADVTLTDGRVVHCLFWRSSAWGSGTEGQQIGGMDCDWGQP